MRCANIFIGGVPINTGRKKPELRGNSTGYIPHRGKVCTQVVPLREKDNRCPLAPCSR